MTKIELAQKAKAFLSQRRVEQVIGREAETATLLSRRLFTPNLRGGGFRPRQLGRSAATRF